MSAPRIAVVTPWNGYQEDWLRYGMHTVVEQTMKVDHLVVVDEVIASFHQVRRMQLPGALRGRPRGGFGHSDTGNLARGLGALLCVAEDYDAITFLDADNWIDANHVHECWTLHERTGVPIVAARRAMHALTGELLYDEPDEHAVQHVDTNCMFFTRKAFDLLSLWTQIPRELAHVGDQVFWLAARQWLNATWVAGIPPYVAEPTVHYRTAYAEHYAHAGREPPPNAKHIDRPSAKLELVVKGFKVQL